MLGLALNVWGRGSQSQTLGRCRDSPLGTERTVSIRGEPSHADIWAGRVGGECSRGREELVQRPWGMTRRPVWLSRVGQVEGVGQSVRNFALTPSEAGSSGVGHTRLRAQTSSVCKRGSHVIPTVMADMGLAGPRWDSF